MTKLNKKTIKLMSVALTELAEWSDYSNLDEDVEEKIKNIIEETYMQHAYLNESRRGGIPRYAVRAVVSSSYHESGNLQYVFEHV